ncbi:MAG: hypothetical protein IJH65_12680, partial [Methanobrevibacter sp.]|nr:hypothetical protein [Methanobrevibacter sp.]
GRAGGRRGRRHRRVSDRVLAGSALPQINSICFQYLTRGHTQDGNIYPKLLPFPIDYTNNWNDKLVCEYFNITGYIDNEHAVPNSEWEIILNTMKPFL